MTKQDLIRELEQMAELDIATPASIDKARGMTESEIASEFVCMSVSEAADLLVSLN